MDFRIHSANFSAMVFGHDKIDHGKEISIIEILALDQIRRRP
jgi:hypothetical protein